MLPHFRYQIKILSENYIFNVRMTLLGTLLKKGIKIRESIDQEYSSSYDLQKNVLKQLLITASTTAFGKRYKFISVLEEFRNHEPKHFYKVFKGQIPVFDYNTIYEMWWKRTLEGEEDICWPGKINYFALSSGTSEAASKHIPITSEMVKAIKKTSIRQILSLSKYNLPDYLFESGILMLGGSTHLNFNGRYFSGDLSGITASQLPFWFQHFYKPGKRIAKTRDWEEKLQEIIEKAPHWDIGVIVGVPAWIQILLERIIAHYKVDHIHEIWPNLSIYVHGGVSFEPYKKGFNKLLGRPINYIETYLASEGFIAFQAVPGRSSMRMVLNNGIFYEFIPFDHSNFHSNGELKPDHQSFMVDEVEEGKDYALLISSCAGAWRYMIGDTIRFTSVRDAEIVITGRTKHFLSLCGEHLSVDNMNKAVALVAENLNIEVKEFIVAGIAYDSLFAHHWYIGTDDAIDATLFRSNLDEVLKQINDDYRVERSAALKEVFVDVLPSSVFYKWLKEQGKEGGQNKVPRVIKDAQLANWTAYLERTNQQSVLKHV
jgi:hypothetical protein